MLFERDGTILRIDFLILIHKYKVVYTFIVYMDLFQFYFTTCAIDFHPNMSKNMQARVGIIYNKSQEASLCAGECLVAAWLVTDGIILKQKNAEQDTDFSLKSSDRLRFLAKMRPW